MKSYTQEELEEKYKQLPATMEEVIFGVNAEKTLEEIGKKYKLHIDRLGILANETRLVMLGLTHPKDFINNLAERLELDKEAAKNIAQEINQRIFHEIREELKKIHNIGETDDSGLKIKKFPPAGRQAKFRIQDLRKEKLPEPPAIKSPPIIESPATELPPTAEPPTESSSRIKPAEKPKIPTTPFEHKLKSEETVRAPLEEIKIPTEQKLLDKKYAAEDPYREPLE